MASLNTVNPNAEIARLEDALQINVAAAGALKDVLASNLGPKGTVKMLVSGAGDIKITKDGKILLGEMQIQHPTASLIARVASSQDDITGDGTTSIVLLIGEILKQASIYISEGVHPRQIAAGIDIAVKIAVKELEHFIIKDSTINRDILLCVAKSALYTKLQPNLAEHLSPIVADAVLSITPDPASKNGNIPNECIDLHMVEIMEMTHQLDIDTKLIKGLVLDHGGRHPNMPKQLKDCYILTCNVSFEYDKTEINSGFFYKSSSERQKMVDAERVFTNNKVHKVIELKRQVCTEENGKTFVVINQKGIDPISLEMLAKEGILALRRAKRRNMERLMKCCGGQAMHSVDELTPDCLGMAGRVYQINVNEENYTFIEDTPKKSSVTILIKGPARHTLSQIKDAVRDGLRSVSNVIDVKSQSLDYLLPGCGSIEIALYNKLMEYKLSNEMLKEQYGLQAFADALLIIPKVITRNGGFDCQDVIAKIQNEYRKKNLPVGINLLTGEAIDPITIGVYDNYVTKKLMIENACSIASNLLLVDEIVRAGLNSLKPTSDSNRG